MVRRRTRSRPLPAARLLPVALLVSALLIVLAGCGGQGPSIINSPVPLTSAAVSTGPVPIVRPVSIAVQLSGAGGSASLVIKLGVPAPVSTLAAEPAVQACLLQLHTFGATEADTLAMPVSLALTLMSGSAGSAGVDLSRVGMVADGKVTDPAGTLLWAKAYGSKPACSSDTGAVLNPGAVEFAGITRGTVNTFRAWILLAGSISSADPTGTAALFSALLLEPSATLGTAATSLTYASAAAVVRCPALGGATGTSLYIPLTRSGALSRGCSP